MLSHFLSSKEYFFTTRAGLPTAILADGISLFTTEWAPITQPSPIVTPGKTITPSPNQQFLPILTGAI